MLGRIKKWLFGAPSVDQEAKQPEPSFKPAQEVEVEKTPSWHKHAVEAKPMPAQPQADDAEHVKPKDQGESGVAEEPYDFIALDIETTGLSRQRDEIIEVAMFRIRSGELQHSGIQFFIKPSKSIPPFITQLTGITDAMVEDGRTLEAAVEAIKEFVGDSLLVSYNASFDFGFIAAAFERCGIEFPNNRVECALKLVRAAVPGLDSYKLESIAKQAGWLDGPQEHRAAGDAILAAKAYVGSMRILKRNGREHEHENAVWTTASKPKARSRKTPIQTSESSDSVPTLGFGVDTDVEGVKVYGTVTGLPQRQVVERLNDDGVPEFKYRYHPNLAFETPSEFLRLHRVERFIPRPNGSRELIEDAGGRWFAVSEWDDPERARKYEEEQFRYIGGSQVYIDLLLAVRAVYESSTNTPIEKKLEIERICMKDQSVYTIRHVFTPPWESLLVASLSIGKGMGPHRVGLIQAAGIKTISDVRSRTDKDLLGIDGIGKAAVSALRSLAAQWVYDPDTEVIEKDEALRRIVSN